jgi:hypothetical protein
LLRFLRVTLLGTPTTSQAAWRVVSSWWPSPTTTGRDGRDDRYRDVWLCAWRKRCA